MEPTDASPSQAGQALAEGRPRERWSRRTGRLPWGRLIAGTLAVLAITGVATLRVWPPLATVMSGSMAPTIKTGDVVVLKRLGRAPRVGEIVAIAVPEEARSRYGYPSVVIHRIVRISKAGTVRTKGDARPQVDPFTVPESVVTTRVVATIPAAGQVIAFLTSGLGLLWLLGGGLVLGAMPLLDRHRDGQMREELEAVSVHAHLQAISEELAQLRAERLGAPAPQAAPAPDTDPYAFVLPSPPLAAPAPSPALAPPPLAPAVPTFATAAADWLQARIDGAHGNRPIAASTAADYRSRIARHLLPFFGELRLDAIDADLCRAFTAHKRAEAEELRSLIAGGLAAGDQRGRPVRPLGVAAIRRLADCLAAILDQAVEDGHLTTNPARGGPVSAIVVPAMHGRLFLERPELAMLTEAAAAQDAPLSRPSGAERPAQYVGRRTIVALLAGCAAGVQQLCDLRIRDVRLHAAAGAQLRPTGGGTHPLSPGLVEEIVAHLDRLRRAGRPTDQDAHVFPNARGGPMQRRRINEIVRQAGVRASAGLTGEGLPALPDMTPRTLRATYLSLLLLADDLDVARVLRATEAADAALVADVADQLRQRLARAGGGAADLRHDAREQLYGPTADPDDDRLVNRARHTT